MVNVACIFVPTDGARKAPPPLPVPTVTGPARMPSPASVPAFTLHRTRAGARAEGITHPQGARADGCCAGVGVGAGQSQRASTQLGERTAGALVNAAVLNHARKAGALVVAANRQSLGPEKDQAVPGQGADRYPG